MITVAAKQSWNCAPSNGNTNLKELRSPVALNNFNLEMRTYGYDFDKWRDSTRMKSNFQTLDGDSGRGWDLALKLKSFICCFCF